MGLITGGSVRMVAPEVVCSVLLSDEEPVASWVGTFAATFNKEFGLWRSRNRGKRSYSALALVHHHYCYLVNHISNMASATDSRVCLCCSNSFSKNLITQIGQNTPLKKLVWAGLSITYEKGTGTKNWTGHD